MNATVQDSTRAAPPVDGATRKRARFVTAVWGDSYIRRFAALSLPSFVAPGNLPALALATDLEVLILTRSADVARFDTHPAFRRLRGTCGVRFIAIDDLIASGVYGVTLTLAYARAVIDSGEAMLRTHFVFMNADFVLADGSLRALCRHIVADRAIVLAPSFRAVAEAIEPQLEAAVDERSGVLAIAPRELAALSMPHPHATTLAKVVNHEIFHSSHPNQFFWQVDDSTLIGHYYLIFMLCIRPERIIGSINCFCDYAFIPEMCPSGDEVAMDDSDEFFMLELQKREQELHMLRLGSQDEAQIARSLQEWTTAEHRRAARHAIVFHADDIPPGIDAMRAQAKEFIGRIDARLGEPVPHGAHRYWIRGVEAWNSLRTAQGAAGRPAELAPPSAPGLLAGAQATLLRWFWRAAHASVRSVFGRWPLVTLMHPIWADARHLREVVGRILALPDARVLVVRNWPERIDPLFAAASGPRFAFTGEMIENGLPGPAAPQRFSHVLIYLLESECRQARRLVDACAALLDQDGVACLFIQQSLERTESGEFSRELLATMDEIIPATGWVAEGSFVGSAAREIARGFFPHSSTPTGVLAVLRLPWVALRLAIALPLMLAVNCCAHFSAPTSRHVSYCTSAALRLMRQHGRDRLRPLSVGGADAPN